MVQARKQLMELLESMSEAEIQQIRDKLVEPRRRALDEEKKQLERRLQEINREVQSLQGAAAAPAAAPAPRRKRGRPARAAQPAAQPAPAAAPKPAERAGRRGRPPKLQGSMAEKIRMIMERAGGAVRVKDIADALVRSGEPRKKGLVNYVNRTLSQSPMFRKSGWGQYELAASAGGGAAEPPVRKKPGPKPGRKPGRPRAQRAPEPQPAETPASAAPAEGGGAAQA